MAEHRGRAIGSWSVAAQAQRKLRDCVIPEAPRSDTIDDYHGTRVADPFRPAGRPRLAATRAWVEAENKVTFCFLETIPERRPSARA